MWKELFWKSDRCTTVFWVLKPYLKRPLNNIWFCQKKLNWCPKISNIQSLLRDCGACLTALALSWHEYLYWFEMLYSIDTSGSLISICSNCGRNFLDDSQMKALFWNQFFLVAMGFLTLLIAFLTEKLID